MRRRAAAAGLVRWRARSRVASLLPACLHPHPAFLSRASFSYFTVTPVARDVERGRRQRPQQQQPSQPRCGFATAATAGAAAREERVPRKKKALGQHFLKDAGVLRRIAKAVRAATAAADGECADGADATTDPDSSSSSSSGVAAAASVASLLEIGPGSGNLTTLLLEDVAAANNRAAAAAGAHFVGADAAVPDAVGADAGKHAGARAETHYLDAVEVDPRMVRVLHKEFAPQVTTGALRLFHKDVLDFLDEEVLLRGSGAGVGAGTGGGGGGDGGSRGVGRRYVTVVGNLPYNISSPILARLTAPAAPAPPGLAPGRRPHDAWWERAVVMTQKEFADRVLGQPGTSNYSRLSVSSAIFLHAERLFDVGRSSFSPPPKVDSSVMALRPRAHGLTLHDRQQLDLLLRACFHRKNKTLRSVFRRLCPREAPAPSDSDAGSIRDGRGRRRAGRSGKEETSLPQLTLADGHGTVGEDRVFEAVEAALGDLGWRRAREIAPEAFLKLQRDLARGGVVLASRVSERGHRLPHRG